MLIGLTGKARSGKDTVGDYLQNTYGMWTYAFASPIKAACKEIFGWTDEHVHGRLKEKLDPRYAVSPRYAMQTLGTEWGRLQINQDIWLKRAEVEFDRALEADVSLVITDVRFENEASWIRNKGGIVIHVHRPDAQSVNAHSSESGILHEHDDIILFNHGTIPELYQIVDDFISASDKVA